MILESMSTVMDTASVVLADGNSIATKLRTNIAPVAGILVGAVGIKYLFGDNRSMAAFVGFIALGAGVFALIQFGDTILTALGKLVQTILT